MSENGIEEWVPFYDQRCYSRSQFECILVAVGDEITWRAKLRLRKDIERAGKSFRVNRALYAIYPPSKLAERFRRIENLAQRLLKALGIQHGYEIPLPIRHPLERVAQHDFEDIEPFTLPHSKQWSIDEEIFPDYKDVDKQLRTIMRRQPVDGVVAGVTQLRGWARAIRKKFEAQVEHSKAEGQARHKGNEALHELLADLACAYRRAFNRDPGVAHPSGSNKPGGPWLRFLRDCLIPLGVDMSLSAIRELWRRRKPTIEADDIS